MKKYFYIISISISITASAQTDLTAGLLAYYPFTNNPYDASGNGNHPTFNNAALTIDRLGMANSAYHFNGVDNYMQIPNAATLNPGTKMSVCAWVRVTGFYRGACHGNRILMKGDGDYLSGSYNLCFDDNYYTGGINCSTSTVDTLHQEFRGITANTTAPYPYIQKNKWYSIVYTYDGIKGRFYQDCKLIDSTSVTANFTNSFDVYFGKLNASGFPYWFNGDLDEVRIYNRAINQSEINLYGDCFTTPVKMSTFNSSVTDLNKINLTWTVENEREIKEYTIERSIKNSNNFIVIGNLSSKNEVATTYNFIDNNVNPNIDYYYRITINELSGVRKYSSVTKASINKINSLNIAVYPNPSAGIFNVSTNQNMGLTNMLVLNNLGQTILIKRNVHFNGSPVLLNLSNSPAGTYWITIINGNKNIIKKIIKK